VERGAQIIDINMGCPAKKVCNVQAGSALLENEPLVGRILDAVVRAVNVPVTLKIRTGARPEQRNAERIAAMAEAAGVQMLAVHGRTRACAFAGQAEYETIAEVKSRIAIPVLANGDIQTPEDAKRVLRLTGADGIMVGRAAQGRPWLFREIAYYLEHGKPAAALSLQEMGAVLAEHLEGLHQLYGCEQGARIARKHIGWAVRGLPGGEAFRRVANGILEADAQLRAVSEFFHAAAANDPAAEALERQAA
jgi:tRNA-dihydrouridine synthase B